MHKSSEMLPTNQFTYQTSPRIFGKKSDHPTGSTGSKHLQGIGFILSLFNAATSRTHPPGSEWQIGSEKKKGKLDPAMEEKGYRYSFHWNDGHLWGMFILYIYIVSATWTTFCKFSVWGYPKIMIFFYDISVAKLEPWSIICSLLPINMKHIPEKKHTGQPNTLQTARLQSQGCSYLEGSSLRFA